MPRRAKKRRGPEDTARRSKHPEQSQGSRGPQGPQDGYDDERHIQPMATQVRQSIGGYDDLRDKIGRKETPYQVIRNQQCRLHVV